MPLRIIIIIIFFNYFKVLCVKFSRFDFEDKGQAATLSRLRYSALCVVQQSSNATSSIGCVQQDLQGASLFAMSTARIQPRGGGGTIFLSRSCCRFEPIGPALCVSCNRCWNSYIKRILSALQKPPPLAAPASFLLPARSVALINAGLVVRLAGRRDA